MAQGPGADPAADPRPAWLRDRQWRRRLGPAVRRVEQIGAAQCHGALLDRAARNVWAEGPPAAMAHAARPVARLLRRRAGAAAARRSWQRRNVPGTYDPVRLRRVGVFDHVSAPLRPAAADQSTDRLADASRRRWAGIAR